MLTPRLHFNVKVGRLNYTERFEAPAKCSSDSVRHVSELSPWSRPPPRSWAKHRRETSRITWQRVYLLVAQPYDAMLMSHRRPPDSVLSQVDPSIGGEMDQVMW